MAGELVDIGTRKIYVDRRGMGDPLLLVHGLYPGATHDEWRHNVAALASHFTVFGIDLLGFGDSDAPHLAYTTQLFHHLLRDFIATRIDAPAHVVAAGESCAAAVRLGVYDDQLVRSLTLVCPVERPHEVTLIDRVNQFLYGTLPFGSGQYEAAVEPSSLRGFLDDRYANPQRHATRERLDAIRANASRPDSLWPFVSMMTGYVNLDVFKPLRSVRRPTLIVWGELLGDPPRDQLLLPAAWSQGKQVETIAASRHWPHDEQSAAFNRIVLHFLQGVETRSAIA